MKTVTAAQMRELDAHCIRSGIGGEVLMERAGAGTAAYIADFVRRLAPVHVRRFVFLAGKGNNGGDAYVAARHLRTLFPAVETVVVSVIPVAELRGEAALNAQRLPKDITLLDDAGVEALAWRPGDIIVDGLLGTGFSGALRPRYAQWIDAVNRSGMPVIAIDLPSGLNADTGEVATAAVRADLTVTVALPKTGLYRGRGPELCGQLRCADIGVPGEFIAAVESPVTISFAADLLPRLGRLAADCHKNSRGRLTVFGGCCQYPGAPLLSASAAMHSGCGYVRLALPASAELSTSHSAALVVRRLHDDGVGFGAEAVSGALALLEQSDALAVGPGIGHGAGLTAFLTALLPSPLPAVIDADALNWIADNPGRYRKGGGHVLTPHPGEMRRLLTGYGLSEALEAERPVQAKALAEATGATVALKGLRTVVCGPDGRISLCGTGTPALAKAGSGDCLSGIIGTFLAQGMTPFEAAETGAFVHGLAAELSPAGMRGTTVDALIGLIPAALREISPFA